MHSILDWLLGQSIFSSPSTKEQLYQTCSSYMWSNAPTMIIYLFIFTSTRWSRISNTKISSHFGIILFPTNAITMSGRLDILSNFWLFKMWPFKQIALHKSVLTHLNLAHLSTSNFLRIWGWETWSRRKVRTHRLGRSRVWFLAPKTRWLIFHIYLFKNCADVAQLPITCFEPGLSGVWIDLSVKGHNPYSSVIRVLFRL